MITVEHNLEHLARSMQMYVRASGKTVDEVIKKKSKDFSITFARELGALAPAKGKVKAERLAALKAGEGLRIRPRVWKKVMEKFRTASLISDRSLVMVRGTKQKIVNNLRRAGKQLNLYALAVMRELSTRESGRGFLRQSSKFAGPIEKELMARSRYNVTLADMAFNPVEHSTTFRWGGFSELSDSAVKGIGRTRGMAALNRALQTVAADMLPYLQRKLGETAVAAGLK